MPKRIVREDVHGVFVMMDGQVFRPQLNDRFFGGMPDKRETTKMKVGLEVNVKHRQDNLWADVGNESWCFHGNHIYWTPVYGDMKRPSSECWNLGTG